ncbi:unnamed protein product, partial [Protopolystoma xenopodis]
MFYRCVRTHESTLSAQASSSPIPTPRAGHSLTLPDVQTTRRMGELVYAHLINDLFRELGLDGSNLGSPMVSGGVQVAFSPSAVSPLTASTRSVSGVSAGTPTMTTTTPPMGTSPNSASSTSVCSFASVTSTSSAAIIASSGTAGINIMSPTPSTSAPGSGLGPLASSVVHSPGLKGPPGDQMHGPTSSPLGLSTVPVSSPANAGGDVSCEPADRRRRQQRPRLVFTSQLANEAAAEYARSGLAIRLFHPDHQQWCLQVGSSSGLQPVSPLHHQHSAVHTQHPQFYQQPIGLHSQTHQSRQPTSQPWSSPTGPKPTPCLDYLGSSREARQQQGPLSVTGQKNRPGPPVLTSKSGKTQAILHSATGRLEEISDSFGLHQPILPPPLPPLPLSLPSGQQQPQQQHT